LAVIYNDGRKVNLKVRPLDCVAFEEKYDIAITEAFRRDVQPKVTYLYFLAWSATDTTLDMSDWLRSIETIEIGSADDAAPLVDAAPAASSRPSRSRPASPPKS
jgi:hypothetical protein